MKIKYQDLIFRGKARKSIEQANAIIEEYAEQGYSLTLRQLYYQFVSRGLCENKQREYERLSVVISNGRRAGLIDWDAIVDRTRFVRKPATWDSPVDIVEASAKQFKLDLWENQDFYVEIWFEKDALLGVFERSAEPLRLPLFSCRGYGSDSACWEAAQRFIKQQSNKICLVLHFGDHDPSGIDMTRDIRERLELFGADVEIRRMALNMAQVHEYSPPPNPAKESDSRFADYKENFGDESWELDALNPDILNKIVRDTVAEIVDDKQWAKDARREDKHRHELQGIAERWDSVAKFVNNAETLAKKRKK